MLGRIFLGRYEVQRLLGEGGMGRVYLARQLDLQRQVVLKVMHDHVAADPKFRERFQRETLLMARFQHPYAVTLYDATLNDPEGPCIVMEYVRGDTLDVVLARNRRLSPVRVGRLLGQLCEVLQAAHSQGIIHRDLKPANLMLLDADTPYEKTKVMDFGLAKLTEGQSLQQAADSGKEFAIGTPAYMCPEQVRGDEMDHRGDLYSVGVMIYELLTGRLPFTGHSTMDILLAQATDAPPKMNEVSEVWVPPAIEAVVLKCLEKRAESRPASARELAQMYDDALTAQEFPPEPEAPAELSPEEMPEPVPVDTLDPSVVVYHLHAWMPETIAAYKLRGFIDDVGGHVTENVPGKIRVRLGGRGSLYDMRPRGPLAWLRLGASNYPIELELHLQHNVAGEKNKLRITVILRNLSRSISTDWRPRCSQIFCDLRAYLIGQSGSVEKG